MLSASKLCHSSSISGPSTTRYPIRVKTSTIRSSTIVMGWSVPAAGRRPGSEMSTASPPRPASPVIRTSSLRRHVVAGGERHVEPETQAAVHLDRGGPPHNPRDALGDELADLAAAALA